MFLGTSARLTAFHVIDTHCEPSFLEFHRTQCCVPRNNRYVAPSDVFFATSTTGPYSAAGLTPSKWHLTPYTWHLTPL